MWVAMFLVCEGLLIDSCELVQHDEIYYDPQVCELEIKEADDYLTAKGFYTKGICSELYAKEKPNNDHQI